MFSSQRQVSDPSRSQGKTNQDGVIVWDQKGLVIVWQDGHRSRFFWQELRAICACQDCQIHESFHTDNMKREAA